MHVAAFFQVPFVAVVKQNPKGNRNPRPFLGGPPKKKHTHMHDGMLPTVFWDCAVGQCFKSRPATPTPQA